MRDKTRGSLTCFYGELDRFLETNFKRGFDWLLGNVTGFQADMTGVGPVF